MAQKNIRKQLGGRPLDIFVGSFLEFGFRLEGVWEDEWDLILINTEEDYDRQFLYLETLWKHLGDKGLIVMDNLSSHEPSNDAFFNFCKVRNREPMTFKTRYGTGIVQK